MGHRTCAQRDLKIPGSDFAKRLLAIRSRIPQAYTPRLLASASIPLNDPVAAEFIGKAEEGTINGLLFPLLLGPRQNHFSLESSARMRNANRYAYAGDDPTNNLDPSGQDILGLSCANEISLGAGAVVGAISGLVVAGLADVFTGGIAAVGTPAEATLGAGLIAGGVLLVGDGINSCNGSGLNQ